ncbi:hypothetical protein [Dictyobacter kobayashii]|uniref:DUF4177 domain-containing protein n=1 Tax=Dictyobacter kobayashii TaxID=2014872 RepID=A0A402AQ33_9CHLR|nr:hypothetical protein [Dictyobacter kobayashii]GCE21278.1 hypothetical protein KDK_50780 [Dictyobacter kobayashii]
MDQWEYLHVGFKPGEIEDATRHYGQDGWELCSMIVTRYRRDTSAIVIESYDAEKFAAVFKRRIVPFEKI